jgi:hypothetical protein
LLRTTLTFGEEVTERQMTAERITAVERQVSANLLEVLNMADQARLEGRRGATNSAAAIEAASSIVRIAYRFEIIARSRIAESPVLQHGQLLQRQSKFEQACCATLELQLAKLARSDSPERLAQSSSAPTIDLTPLSDDLASSQGTHLPPETQSLLESYRRLPILLMNLDTSLSRITDTSADP